MQPEIVALIQKVVENFVSISQMFTAYEVSKEVQTQGKAAGLPFVRHTQMQGTVHDHITPHVQSGEYQKALRDVGATNPAFVYYPTGADVDQYEPLDRKDKDASAAPTTSALGISQPGAIDADDGDDDDDDDDDDDGGVSPATQALMGAAGAAATKADADANAPSITAPPDARGRACVRSEMVLALGWSIGDTVHVEAGRLRGDPCVIVTQKKTPNTIVSYTVDKNHNIRVHDHALETAGLKGKTVKFIRCDVSKEIVIVAG